MDSTEELAQRLEAAEAHIEQLDQLLRRAYEDTHRAAGQVLSARRDPGYAAAFAAEPLVTARIGAFRGGDLLFERAIASIRAQTHRNWEAVVVCDGQDEETAARIAALGDDRIRCLQRPRNGPYPEVAEKRWLVAGTHPFNQAVAFARGAWIAPIDQDDEWFPDHLEVLLAAAREHGAEVVYGASRVDLADGSETWFGSWPPRLGDFGFQAAIYHAGLAPLLYDANSYLVGEPADWNLARRMVEAGAAFEFVDRVVTTYHVEPGQQSWTWWKAREEEKGAFPGGPEVRLAVYGSRPDGHANVVLDLFGAVDGHDFVGLLDDWPENAERFVAGLRVIGGTGDLGRLAAEGLEGVVLGFGAARGRTEVLEAITAAGLALPTLIHPRAFVAASAKLERGVQVMPQASIGPNARLGEGVLVNTGALVDHDVVVGRGSVVDPGAVLTGRVRIGSEVEIGSGAVLIPDSVVEDDAIVGAGAVIVRPVAAGTTVVGVPARPLAAS